MSTVTIDGVEVHYDDLGSGDQVIVWGHGFLFSASLYHDLIDRMPGYRHIAIDFRGHGRTASVTEDCTLARMAEDVHALTRQLGIGRFVYIGHSMGNGVGMRLSAAHPETIQAGVGIAFLPAAGMPDTCRSFAGSVAAFQGDEEQLTAGLAHLYVHEDMDDMIKASGRSAALVRSGPMNQIAGTELFLDESDRLLPALTQPWLFLVPADDAGLPADAQMATARAVRGARVMWFNNEGHLLPQERPAETTAVIRAFLNNLGI